MKAKKYHFSKNGEGERRTIVPVGERYRTDRVDITIDGYGKVTVTQFTRYKATRKHIPHTWTTYAPEVGFDRDLAVEWLKDHGFVVEVWPKRDNGWWAGARAWRGEEKWPIRHGWEVHELRQKLKKEYWFWRDNPLKRKELGLTQPLLTQWDLDGMDLAFVG